MPSLFKFKIKKKKVIKDVFLKNQVFLIRSNNLRLREYKFSKKNFSTFSFERGCGFSWVILLYILDLNFKHLQSCCIATQLLGNCFFKKQAILVSNQLHRNASYSTVAQSQAINSEAIIQSYPSDSLTLSSLLICQKLSLHCFSLSSFISKTILSSSNQFPTTSFQKRPNQEILYDTLFYSEKRKKCNLSENKQTINYK